MSNRHYWPEPPQESSDAHLVEHKNGEVERLFLDKDGEWANEGASWWRSTESMVALGYLGVRTPFSAEAERVEFEAVFGPYDKNDECDLHGRTAWDHALSGWLAAKRHERGL